MRSGQKPDAILDDVDHGGPHSSPSSSPWLGPHSVFQNLDSLALP